MLETIPNLELLEVDSNAAKFISPDGQGHIEWTYLESKNGKPFNDDNDYFSITGQSVLKQNINTLFSAPTLEINEIKDADGKINPTKLFWLVAKALEALVCPNCSDGID